MADPDDIFESFFKLTLPLWGPFYALYYILRLLWRRDIRRK